MTDQSSIQNALILERLHRGATPRGFSEVEYSIFSQFGDDGIIQYLTKVIPDLVDTFVEFGVQDYSESNTRLLLMKDNWQGMVIDGSKALIDHVRAQDYYWRHTLHAVDAFITKDNINDLISSTGITGEIGLLSVDIDGVDYWVWEQIKVIQPTIIVCEYNSTFGSSRTISVPYRADFIRTDAHHSNLYYGASLGALTHLANSKGYALLGSNSAGNNCYFVKRERLGSLVEKTVEESYVESRFRESRGEQGELTLLTGSDKAAVIAGLPVVNVVTGNEESL